MLCTITDARRADTATTRTPAAFAAKPTPRDEAPAGQGHEHLVQIRQLLEQLDRDGPLPFDDVGIVEGVDERQAARGGEGRCALFGRVVAVAAEDQRGAGLLDPAQLERVRPVGNAHGGGDADVACNLRDSAAMVAGGDRDDAPAALRPIQLEDPVGRSAHLEGAGSLE